MDLLEALAKEKEASVAAARESTLPPRAFGVYWTLKDDAALQAAGVSAMEFAEEAQALVDRFPNAAVNTDEQRRLRISLYNPLLRVESGERGRIVRPSLGYTAGRRHRCRHVTTGTKPSGSASSTGRSASTSPLRASESET